MNENTQGLIDIGKMILTFAKVNRVTLHEDGITPESDTDHTVMLSVCACSLASKLYPELDLGKIAQFAIVHDLVEVYALDTNTINITDNERQNKKDRERSSFGKIQKEFGGVYPWISDTIEKYESLDTREARFIKILDKSMTKVTNILNKGEALRKLSVSREEIIQHFSLQTKEFTSMYGEEFSELISITEELMDTMIRVSYKE